MLSFTNLRPKIDISLLIKSYIISLIYKAKLPHIFWTNTDHCESLVVGHFLRGFFLLHRLAGWHFKIFGELYWGWTVVSVGLLSFYFYVRFYGKTEHTTMILIYFMSIILSWKKMGEKRCLKIGFTMKNVNCKICSS